MKTRESITEATGADAQKGYSPETLCLAATALAGAGRLEPVFALLGHFGVGEITALCPAQYGAFAAELRLLGAVF